MINVVVYVGFFLFLFSSFFFIGSHVVLGTLSDIDTKSIYSSSFLSPYGQKYLSKHIHFHCYFLSLKGKIIYRFHIKSLYGDIH